MTVLHIIQTGEFVFKLYIISERNILVYYLLLYYSRNYLPSLKNLRH